jgi:hypothetical protein
MKKMIYIGFFLIELLLLGITVYQVVCEGTSMIRALQSMLILLAFAKTEYDFIQLEKKQNPGAFKED